MLKHFILSQTVWDFLQTSATSNKRDIYHLDLFLSYLDSTDMVAVKLFDLNKVKNKFGLAWRAASPGMNDDMVRSISTNSLYFIGNIYELEEFHSITNSGFYLVIFDSYDNDSTLMKMLYNSMWTWSYNWLDFDYVFYSNKIRLLWGQEKITGKLLNLIKFSNLYKLLTTK